MKRSFELPRHADFCARRRYLFKRALTGRLVGTPSHKSCPMTESLARHMVEANFHDEFRPERYPFAAALSTPSARTARRPSGKARWLTKRFQTPRQTGPLFIRYRRG